MKLNCPFIGFNVSKVINNIIKISFPANSHKTEESNETNAEQRTSP